MLGFIKRLRIVYSLYNFFHKGQLIHNLAFYRRHGIRKKYFSSVSSKDFIQLKDMPSPAAGSMGGSLRESTHFRALSPADQASLLAFPEQGYAILRNFYDDGTVEKANEAIESLLRSGRIKFRQGGKIMFAFRQSPQLKAMGKDPRLNELLHILMGSEPLLFQSINFLQGSEQDTHSDSIHMTTFPLGRLIAVWIALEDIGTDNGPLHYYPGSHKLPYYLNSDYDNEGNSWLIGDKEYTAYEEMIREKIRESGLPKQVFTAGKGDILIWHANLCHGGEPHLNKERSRKSMVFHYFGKDAICYHEITQRPALLKPE
ncbi:MAG TPA: phytanoyl-CoA dioxygenase family protein [Flavisolibacter sp.]|nr:phytanoyl-CoA dioxygenase family protein [Flavisolibacter sp.]